MRGKKELLCCWTARGRAVKYTTELTRPFSSYCPEQALTFGPGLWPYQQSRVLPSAPLPLHLQPLGHSANRNTPLSSTTVVDVSVFPLDCCCQGQRLCLICSVYPGVEHSQHAGGWRCCLLSEHSTSILGKAGLAPMGPGQGRELLKLPTGFRLAPELRLQG